MFKRQTLFAATFTMILYASANRNKSGNHVITNFTNTFNKC